MNDMNSNNDPLEGFQAQVLRQARAAEEAHVRMVLREHASPPITNAALLPPDVADRHGIGLVYQPTEHLMWVTQHGEQIGPKLSTKITFAHEPANR